MAHRGGDRGDRVRERERDRPLERDDTRRREPARDPPRGERRMPIPLNEYFVDGEGIHREVMQTEICKYLGAEATSRPTEYNRRKGYLVKALRPFTPDMLDDLRKMSEAYVSENRANVEQGYRDLSYAESETRRRQDGSILSSVDRWPSPASVYPGDNNYTMHSGYPPENVYPPGGPGYSTGLGYTTAAGPISGHPAYTYEHPGVGEYPPQGYAYAPASMYGGRGQPRDPGLPVGYYSGTSAPEMSGRGARVDEGYGQYYETQPLPSPAGRGGYNVPGRGNPSAYDIPQAREYATRQEPTRDAYGGNRRR